MLPDKVTTCGGEAHAIPEGPGKRVVRDVVEHDVSDRVRHAQLPRGKEGWLLRAEVTALGAGER